MSRSRARVRVGYLVDPLPPATYVRAGLQVGRALGADDLWFGDHVRHIVPKSLWQTTQLSRFVPDLDAWYDPTTLIARFCRRHGPRMGTMVTDPVRRSPADLARAWMSMHHMSGGNVVLGIGAGEAMNIEPVGLSVGRGFSRLDDALGAIRAAWSADGGFVNHEGPFHSWRDATFPPPYKGTTPPIWVAAHGPKTCGTAGRHGDGWIYMAQNFEQWQIAAGQVAAGAADAGKDVGAMEWSLLTVVMLSSNPNIQRRLVGSPLVKATALAMPGSLWTVCGATHPFGPNFPGPYHYSVLDGSGLFEGESFQEACKAVTPELLEQMFAFGPAESVMERLAPFVENGVSHMTIVNWSLSAGFGVAADSFREQRKLNRMLKSMAPGRRSWASTLARQTSLV
jgi:phthiodiolone/phenolphthiodiolone dimycocerosates ketoreductase